jgi:hypothetical protein
LSASGNFTPLANASFYFDGIALNPSIAVRSLIILGPAIHRQF